MEKAWLVNQQGQFEGSWNNVCFKLGARVREREHTRCLAVAQESSQPTGEINSRLEREEGSERKKKNMKYDLY